MHWITKAFPRWAQWAPDQDRFADLQMNVAAAGGDYQAMLMVLAKSDAEDVIIIGLPDAGLKRHFEGYQDCAEELPAVDALLVGSQTLFEETFRLRGEAV